MSTNRVFLKGLTTKKRYTKQARRYEHRGNYLLNRPERNEKRKALLETYYCFPHHDMLVREFGRKAADCLGRMVRANKIDFKKAFEAGDNIVRDFGINVVRGNFGRG
jgi:hypothetical protein